MPFLSPEQVRAYRDTGVLIVNDFFSPREVRAMLAELDRFQDEGLIRNVATDGDGKTHSSTAMNLQIIPLNDKSGLFRALPFAAKVAGAVGQLIGDDFVRYLDQIFLKPGRHGAGTNWHQDNAYFKIPNPLDGVGMWTAMHDSTVANGTLHLVPGSHHEALEHVRDGNSDHHITCRVSDDAPVVPVETPAGGVAFFNFAVAHCTKGNQTDKPRAGLAYHFLATPAVPQQKWEQQAPPVMVSGPGSTGGVKEYGVEVASTWEREVDAVLAGAAAPS